MFQQREQSSKRGRCLRHHRDKCLPRQKWALNKDLYDARGTHFCAPSQSTEMRRRVVLWSEHNRKISESQGRGQWLVGQPPPTFQTVTLSLAQCSFSSPGAHFTDAWKHNTGMPTNLNTFHTFHTRDTSRTSTLTLKQRPTSTLNMTLNMTLATMPIQMGQVNMKNKRSSFSTPWQKEKW